MNARPRSFLCALLVLLTACSARGPLETGDGPPADWRNPDSIADAVPREELRTAAGNKSPYTVLGKTYHVMEESQGYVARGRASWYGRKFHGRNTSNGETYDMWGMTAAHKELPIPSYVQVTNLSNQRSVVVRVNDRGPFHDGRIIDLSYAAALKLGFAEQGTAAVEVRAIEPQRPQATTAGLATGSGQGSPATLASGAPVWYLQLGAFSKVDGAEQERLRLQEMVSQPVMVMQAEGGGYYRVRIGPLVNSGEISQLRRQLGESLFARALVVRESKPAGWYNPPPSMNEQAK